jgi:hypothetical protein
MVPMTNIMFKFLSVVVLIVISIICPTYLHPYENPSTPLCWRIGGHESQSCTQHCRSAPLAPRCSPANPSLGIIMDQIIFLGNSRMLLWLRNKRSKSNDVRRPTYKLWAQKKKEKYLSRTYHFVFDNICLCQTVLHERNVCTHQICKTL